jgi:hypothetical protein
MNIDTIVSTKSGKPNFTEMEKYKTTRIANPIRRYKYFSRFPCVDINFF